MTVAQNVFRKDLVPVQIDALQDVEVLPFLIWRSEGWSDNDLDAVGHTALNLRQNGSGRSRNLLCKRNL